MIHQQQTETSLLMKEFVDCFTQQISELELLKSMYPNNGEITVADNGILNQILQFIDGNSDFVPNNLEFVINLVIDGMKLEIHVNLPVTYPNEEPDIYIRCNQLNRQQETYLNAELANFLTKNHTGEVCLYTAVTWLQDNTEIIVVKYQNSEPVRYNETETSSQSMEEDRFTRFWIYSHHIYNKKKREEILKKSKELNLTGFCLPGKPGVICIEGEENACKEWWQIIKSMTWKKIMIRKTETCTGEKSSFRKFDNFEELHFHTTTSSKHANMSEFAKYMTEHGFNDLFSEFFGFNE